MTAYTEGYDHGYESGEAAALAKARDIAQAKIDALVALANDKRNAGDTRRAYEIGYAVSHLANLRDTLKDLVAEAEAANHASFEKAGK